MEQHAPFSIIFSKEFKTLLKFFLIFFVWKSSVRSAVRAASKLSGGEPTDVDDAPE